MARLSEIRRRLGLSPALLPRHQMSSSSSSSAASRSLKGGDKKGKQCGCSLVSSPSLASVTSIILAAGTLALFTPPLLQSFRSAAAASRIQGIQEYDAVIVGAGWAGISAADTLLKGGVENILVLEANDYIGGRYVCV